MSVPVRTATLFLGCVLAWSLCALGAFAQSPLAQRGASAVWVDAQSLVIDGDPGEWRGSAQAPVELNALGQLVELVARPVGENWSGPNDLSVRAWLGWNATDLLLGGEVLDDAPSEHVEPVWYEGDSLELFLDLGARGEAWDEADWQLMLAPNWPERPWGLYPRGEQAAGRERERDGGFGGVEVRAREIAGGYRFEARIPWRNFGAFTPREGARVGFNLAVCDRDRGGVLESYATWTGEQQLSTFADRRGELLLEPAPRGPSAAAAEDERDSPSTGRPYLLVVLAALYGVALATRRLWRLQKARRIATWTAVSLIVAAGSAAVVSRLLQAREREQRVAEVEAHWTQFESIARAGALGVAAPSELLAAAQALAAGRAIAPPPRLRWTPLAPVERALAPAPRRTSVRGLPFVPFVGNAGRQEAFTLESGRALRVRLVGAGAAPLQLDALQLVTRVRDRRYQRFGSAEAPVLAIDLVAGGQPLGAPLEVRHARELHFEEDEHRDLPDLEAVYFAGAGRNERTHGDALLVSLTPSLAADEIVIRHVGPPSGYAVEIVALAAGVRDVSLEAPEPLRATPDGQWVWSGRDEAIEIELAAPGRAPRRLEAGTLVHSLRIAQQPIATAYVRDLAPAPSSALDIAPLAAAVLLAPFLVTVFAQWLATRQRMRGKLAVGFAATSAAPLLALMFLLDASLRSEYERSELERARSELVRAENGLGALAQSLERDAQRFLRLAAMRKQIDGVYPQTPEELLAIWGESDGSVRILERTGLDGQRVVVGVGPNVAQLRNYAGFATGLVRPRGQLLVCGVAQTTPGAEQPLKVVVARAPELPDSSAATQAGAVRLIGAGRDPAPAAGQAFSSSPGELRRPLYDAGDEQLAGVLLARVRARAAPVLGGFTLLELLLSAAITALFTVVLFAGILTGGVVGPIERLDRALRRGDVARVEAEVDDEIGRLAGAIRGYSAEVAERVEQLEMLQRAQGELAQRLDPDQAREAVLQFFQRSAGARSVWLVWRGEAGELPRVWGEGGRSLPLPENAGLLQRALCAGEVLELLDPSGGQALSEFERMLLGVAPNVVCVPLAASGEVRGAVVLGYAQERPAGGLAFLRAAANQSASVLENARLYSQATRDALTGFLTDPGFRQRLAEEIHRVEAEPSAGVVLVQLRLTGLPRDDERAGARLREAAQRLRQAVRGMAVFGRSGAADLSVALPWSGRAPQVEALTRRLIDRVGGAPWSDGAAVSGLFVAHASFPEDGPSARYVLSVLEDRLAEAQTGVPALDLVRLAALIPTDFVARSPLILQLLDTVRRLAEQDLSVLVTGETGVGKDRIAELIHRLSRRASGPLVHVHCPSLSSSLIEDELLGHEKGAFTGALSRRLGPFEFASGGTLVLDEIAGLAPAGQVALLRLLETREVLPLGATRPIPIDVRVVATSSVDLAAEVEAGRLRSDLYFRLNVAQVVVPPLRARPGDVPELVAAFLRRFNSTSARPVTGVDPRVLETLGQHTWPGNVRELENVVARACVLAAGGELGLEHLELEPVAERRGPADAAGLSERQERLLVELAAGERVSSAEFAEREGISARTALRDLIDLAERGFLEREGARRGARFRRTEARFEPRRGRHPHVPVE
ncbi:MAG: sigma 54-interacting transcriptional regulator [Planctomycetes bacterium]|nr:sigma 54-interacting transcriptional regulator [Planctomycetota bacterium]